MSQQDTSLSEGNDIIYQDWQKPSVACLFCQSTKSYVSTTSTAWSSCELLSQLSKMVEWLTGAWAARTGFIYSFKQEETDGASADFLSKTDIICSC